MVLPYKQVFLAALLAIATEAVADFVSVAPDSGSCYTPSGCFELSGHITDIDTLAVKRLTNDLERRHVNGPLVLLNSRGGSVNAGINIGREFRKIRAVAVMGYEHVCFSSCVFALAGATQRMIAGKVGIHRPYSDNAGFTDIDEMQRDYSRLSQASKLFIQEMNIPDGLYEVMVRTPPEEIRILDEEELDAFGLNRTDPVEEDYRDSVDAKERGLSKKEYLQRKSEGKRVCGPLLGARDHTLEEYYACYNRMLDARL